MAAIGKEPTPPCLPFVCHSAAKRRNPLLYLHLPLPVLLLSFRREAKESASVLALAVACSFCGHSAAERRNLRLPRPTPVASLSPTSDESYPFVSPPICTTQYFAVPSPTFRTVCSVPDATKITPPGPTFSDFPSCSKASVPSITTITSVC